MIRMALDKYALVITLFVNAVESKHCSFVTGDGLMKTFFCNAYEYCCGNACCRPAPITFYQLWYFWLSIIFILLLCSGGSWWYRFKYRSNLFSQLNTTMTTTGTTFGPGPSDGTRPPNATGVFYYPGGDRVFFHAVHQGNPPYPFIKSDANQPPYGSTVTQFTQLSHPVPMPGMGHAPPPYAGPPPSYESVVHDYPGVQQVSQVPLRPPAAEVDASEHMMGPRTTVAATTRTNVL